MIRAFGRQHVWFGLFVLCVFATGVGTGVAVARWLPAGPRFFSPPGPPGSPAGPRPVVERLSQDLGLSSEQKARIAEVFEKAQPRFDGFRNRSRAEFATLMQQLNAEIELVLTNEQRTKFRTLMPAFRDGPAGPGAPRPPGGPGEPPGLPGPPPVDLPAPQGPPPPPPQ